MAKRLFELANEIGVKNTDIVRFLKTNDIEKTNFSSLTIREIDLIKRYYEGINNNNWEQLTEKINNPDLTGKDNKELDNLLDSLFGSNDYWVLAKVVKKVPIKETNKIGLLIEPCYILNNVVMKAFEYRLINDFSQLKNKTSIFKLLTEDEMEIINKQKFYGDKYYKVKILRKYYKDKQNREKRFSFTIAGMECIGNNILLEEFLTKYNLDDKSAVYRLVNEDINNATNEKFILSLEQDLRVAIENEIKDYKIEQKKLQEEHEKAINSEKESLKKEIEEFKDTKEKIKRNEKYFIEQITKKINFYERIKQQDKQQKEGYESKLEQFKLIKLLKLKTDLENEKVEAVRNIKGKLAELQDEYNEMKRLLDRYNVILSSKKLEENESENENDKKLLNEFTSFDEMIDYAQEYLYKNDKLIYAKDILKSFYLGLQTDQLILLMGKPGTGKTSLVQKFANMFGFADAAIIPVQSNWSDKGDLLGYYNPLEKNYITTQFLDSLLEFWKEAKKEENKEKLYFICLDEMNLAHIEYYFAEFLSILQGDKRLRLYSNKIKEDIIRELKYSGFTDEEIKDLDENHISLNEKQIAEKVDNDQLTILKRQYYLNLCRMANMIANIPDEITIPERIKFIGTLNQDATTLDISPKVLDRSYIIRINENNAMNGIKLDSLQEYDTQIRYKPIKAFDKNEQISLDKASIDNELIKKLNTIAYYSKRIVEQTFHHQDFTEWCQVIGEKTVIDYILATTFMPRIRLFTEEEKDATKITTLSYLFNDENYEKFLVKYLEKNSCTKIIHDEINTGDAVDFWRS